MTPDVKKTVRDTIENKDLIPKNGHVVLGLSGGPDSMCLFHVLYNMRHELGIELSTVHLNHKFRPGHAEKDQEYVEKICRDAGIHCYSKTIDVNMAAAERGETPEEAGRNERYTAFDEEAERIQNSGIPKDKIAIAVAQNRNDCVETVLMRIFRGTGPDGLSGIPYARKSKEGFNIVRPLLDVDRKDIEDYCESNNLNPRIDHTNSETNYNRNRIRLDLLPKLKSEYNYNIEEALLRLSSLAGTDKSYFDNTVEHIIEENSKFEKNNKNRTSSIIIATDIFNGMHSALSHRIIISILKELGLDQGLESTHVNAAIESINRNQTGKTVEFPNGYRMKIAYGEAVFYNELGTFIPKETEFTSMNVDINNIGEKKSIIIPSGELVFTLTDFPERTSDRNTLSLNYNEMLDSGGVLTIRPRKPGDRISLQGMNGTKKIKDILIDEKVPVEKRDEIPLVLCGENVLWVAGIRKSDKYTVTDETKDRLLLEWKPNN